MSMPYRTDSGKPVPPAASWPKWTDAHTWELTPPPTVGELLAQIGEDLKRLDALDRRYRAIEESLAADDEPYTPTEEDLSDYDQWLRQYEGLPPNCVTDADVVANGLPVG